MRIIGGSLGGRKINPPTKMPFTRPTTDVAKEGLFNTLQNRIAFEGIQSLDLFAGTGSISYELASRGVGTINLVEKDAIMARFIQKNIADFGIEKASVFKMDIFSFLEHTVEQYDFIFAGPPYALANIDTIPAIIMKKNILKPKGLFVLEHTPRNNYQSFSNFLFTKKYGTTIFSFFKA